MADRFWVGGTGTWDASATTHWSTTSGGGSGASAPSATDDVIFDANSNTGTGSFTVTVSSAVCRNFTTGGAGGALDGVMTLSSTGALTISGSLTLPATNFGFSGTSTVTFNATTSQTITSSGVNFTQNLTFNGVGGTWQLQDNLSCSLFITLTNGTIDLNSKTYTCFGLSSNNSNTRVIAYGTGKFVFTGNNNTIWSTATSTNLTLTGTPNNELSYSGGTGTRTINASGTAGGSEAQAPPFRVTGGSDTLSFSAGGSVGTVNLTGFTGSFTPVGTLSYYGDLNVGSAGTINPGDTGTFRATSGTKTITPNGTTWSNTLVINGAGGTFVLAGNLNLGSGFFGMTNGTFDLAGFTLTTTGWSTASGTKNLTWNGGQITATGSGVNAFNNANPTNFTTTAGSGAGVMSLTSASAKTFTGGGSTWNATLNQGGAGTLTITGSNTLTDITNTTNSTSVLFTAGTTNTFTSGFSLGTTTIGSVTAASHTLSKTSGTISVSNNSISRSTAQGGATWNAFTTNGNTDGGNNSGWVFTPNYYDTVTESVTAADTVSITTTLTDAVTETATASDTAASLVVFASTVAESASAADTVDIGGTFNVAVAETATAVDFPNISGLTYSDAVEEYAVAEDTSAVTSPFSEHVDETCVAEDTVTVTQHMRLGWFLSFQYVVPPPEGQGPGNPGKLFGDFELKQIYPPL